MDTCGICGTPYTSEPVFFGKTRAFICPTCLENSHYNYLIICPACSHTSWIPTDKKQKMLTFYEGKCPDCLKEFHAVDGFKRRTL